jgi:hypothetical protein
MYSIQRNQRYVLPKKELIFAFPPGAACKKKNVKNEHFWEVKGSPWLWLSFLWKVTLESWQWFWNLPWSVL